MVVDLNVHRIDRILLQAKEIKSHLDNQIFDEEIAKVLKKRNRKDETKK
jgi:hypothetical protein